MNKIIRVLILFLMPLVPIAAFAASSDEANAVVDSWSAAYTSNEPEAVAKTYAPDAILLEQ